MLSRRLVAVLVVLVAGCTGTLAEVHSSPAIVPDAAYTPAGYVHGNTTEVPLTYPLGIGPVRRDVTVYVWVAGYSRTVETETGNQTAALLVVSSPNRKIEGQSVNPFAHLSNRELVARLFDVVGDVDNATGVSGRLEPTVTNVSDVATLEETAAENHTILGQQAEVVTYTATVRLDAVSGDDASATTETTPETGETKTLLLHLVAVEHGEDVVLALGVHGDEMDEGEALTRLMEAIEHEVTRAE